MIVVMVVIGIFNIAGVEVYFWCHSGGPVFQSQSPNTFIDWA